MGTEKKEHYNCIANAGPASDVFTFSESIHNSAASLIPSPRLSASDFLKEALISLIASIPPTPFVKSQRLSRASATTQGGQLESRTKPRMKQPAHAEPGHHLPACKTWSSRSGLHRSVSKGLLPAGGSKGI